MNAAKPRPAGDGHDAFNASFSTSYAGVLAFIAVASEGSFARAADRLGIGRSAVSRSVQKLESQLGVRLFLRTTRSTTLTREGELFLEGCNPGVTCILQASAGGWLLPCWQPSVPSTRRYQWSCCWTSRPPTWPVTASTWRFATACWKTAR